MWRLRPTCSTGWNEGLFGLSITARSDWPTGCVVHEEWHLKHTSYSAAKPVSAGSYPPGKAGP